MKYKQVWDAVDKLAALQGLSPSGLAKKAGLDSTTFNKSKRTRPDGKQRWPSLDSINKTLEACNMSFEQFYNLLDNELQPHVSQDIPYIALSYLGKEKSIKNNSLVTDNWQKYHFQEALINLYALEIDVTDYEPLIRYGSTLVVAKNSEIRKDDRVVIILKNGQTLLKEFAHRTASSIVFSEISDHRQQSCIPITEIDFIHRILWIGQ